MLPFVREEIDNISLAILKTAPRKSLILELNSAHVSIMYLSMASTMNGCPILMLPIHVN